MDPVRIFGEFSWGFMGELVCKELGRWVLGPAASVCIPITCQTSLPIHPDAKNLSFSSHHLSLFFLEDTSIPVVPGT